MICNKKAHEDLKEACDSCSHYQDCVVGKKCVGVAIATLPLAQESAKPALVSHDYRDVKIGDGMNITIDLKEIERQLAKRFDPARQMFEYGA